MISTKFSKKNSPSSGLCMKDSPSPKSAESYKAKVARVKAQKKYDESNPEKRRAQKRDYMRRKRSENPNYCKWK